MTSAQSSNFPLLHLHHSSFSNHSIAAPTSQLILQPFRCFTYVTAHSPTLLSFLLRQRLFTYVTWRAAHDKMAALLCVSFIYPESATITPKHLFGTYQVFGLHSSIKNRNFKNSQKSKSCAHFVLQSKYNTCNYEQGVIL